MSIEMSCHDFNGVYQTLGPVLGWIHVVQAYKAKGIELPVNLKFCFEGMH